jgi:hypothetical protein
LIPIGSVLWLGEKVRKRRVVFGEIFHGSSAKSVGKR